jgi:hypothetical protein
MQVTGRPSSYDASIGSLVCLRLADGESMRSICRDEGMPSRDVIDVWRETHPDFDAKCARAREDQAEFHHDEMDKIEADTLSGDLAPQAASVVLANKRWRMEKLKPKVYGAKVDMNHGSQPGNPMTLLLQQISGTTIKPVADDAE